jgi:adenylate cyclase
MLSQLLQFQVSPTRQTLVLMVMDVVESVRLMEQDEDEFVQRWRQFVNDVDSRLLPLHRGRLVKSMGDGLMLAFDDATSCLKTAFALQQFAQPLNHNHPPERHIRLRIGAHLAEFVADQRDIYGAGVNLTARIATLAGPEQIVISADLRDHITAGLDADIEDMGDCYLKHMQEPVRAYRVGPVGHTPQAVTEASAPPDFRPTIAVIPFEARSNEPEHFVVGELVADGIIAQLSRSPDIRVISRLSTTAFRGRTEVRSLESTGMLTEVQSRLDASFVLSGSYVVNGGQILLTAKLVDARKNEIVWADRVAGDLGDLLQTQSQLLNAIASASSQAIANATVQESLLEPLPRLDSYALLLGGISLMHRSTKSAFARSRELLDQLVERHNRAPQPLAWLAKWYVFTVVSGFSDDPQRDAKKAIEQTQRALDLDPRNALALAIQGHAVCQLSGDAEKALNVINRAIELNPNEPMSWLYRSVWSSMWGSSQDSVLDAKTAASLSPLDPLRYYFDVVLAASYLTNRNYDDGILAARRSLASNRMHLPTLRVLLGAQAESGRMTDAHQTLQDILKVVPDLTINKYLAMGSPNSVIRQRQVRVLRSLGLPEG